MTPAPPDLPTAPCVAAASAPAAVSALSVPRLDSGTLFARAREIEIAHDGRVYRLRITQSNKLILTA
ncbi:MAG TPA: hemin uptake protein HemP [Burkholderiaceae bacterium]